MSVKESRSLGSPLRVNRDLVWDYDVPAEDEQSEVFRRWYVARVLTRGRAEDLRALGLPVIRAYLPHLTLPAHIRRLWEWYFSLPEVQRRHGSADAPPAPDRHRDRPQRPTG